MKGLLIIIVLGVGGYFLAGELGLIKTGESEAVSTYKQFMDSYIVRRYDEASAYATDSAARKVSSDQSRTSMRFMGRNVDTPLADKGIVEASRVRVIEEREEGDAVHLTLVYSASLSWAGSTANRMSPGSWRHWDQKARLIWSSDGWKVASFSSFEKAE